VPNDHLTSFVDNDLGRADAAPAQGMCDGVARSHGMQLPRRDLLRAYRTMRTIRAFEERLVTEVATGDIPGAVHLYAGQEASATGLCLHLTDRDYISSTHRGHGHAIAKGVDVNGMMAEIFGRATGTCRGKGGSMHIADLDHGMLGANGIVGGGAPLVCGAALSAKTLGTGGIALAFSGDGAFNQGTMAESLNLAMVWQLPVVFVTEDNGVGEATASSFAIAGDILARATAYGMPGRSVDGTDVFAVSDAARVAIAHARSGQGPYFLHVTAPRYYGHYLGDADSYRSQAERHDMRENQDCLKIFRSRTISAGLFEADELDAIDGEIDAMLDAAVAAARAAPQPALEELTRDVYVSYG